MVRQHISNLEQYLWSHLGSILTVRKTLAHAEELQALIQLEK